MRQELHTFQSSNTTGPEFLSGKKGTPVTLAGHLRMPKMTGKQPVVVLLHGAGGVAGSGGPTAAWADILNKEGIGVFVIDSWSGRGLVSIATDTTRFNQMSRIYDLLAALALLEKHPLVDPSKIAVMGSSHGAPAALYSSLKRFEPYHTSDARFAAHISMYGTCNIAFRGEDEVIRPVLMLYGAADDWVAAAPCREYAGRLVTAGKNVRYIEFADAHHWFDAPGLAKPFKVEQGLSMRACTLREGDNGMVFNAQGHPFGAGDPCFQRGTTLHYNEVAAKKAHADVLAFLKGVFAQK
jgi:dienelactone hydrolase